MPESFSYTSFALSDDRTTVRLGYELIHDNTAYTLEESFVFEIALPDSAEVQAALRALHLACGISYYKIFLPSGLSHPYKMEASEAAFWNGVFRGGLGEFLYVNKLEPSRLAQFTAQDGVGLGEGERILQLAPEALLGIGGGKDSIVAGEALKTAGVQINGFVLATGDTTGQAAAVAEAMHVPLRVIKRTIDPQLLQLQQLPGAYKGHIPISLIFGLTGTLLGLALNKGYVIVANEDSASTPRAEWAGEPVNHQWSKSFEFEGALQAYLHTYVSESLTYFSAIRPLGSVGVAKIFAKLPQYFDIFTSDNYVFRMNPNERPDARWSLESPKSLSSFILLSPWLTKDAMLRIFGCNFLDESSLSVLFLELLGIHGEPPLDCVGTPDELRASLTATINQGTWRGSALLELPELASLTQDAATRADGGLEPLLHLSNNQCFPTPLASKLTDTLKEMLA